MQGKHTFRELKIKVSVYYCCLQSLRVAVSKGSIRVGALPIPHLLRMTAELASKMCFSCTSDLWQWHSGEKIQILSAGPFCTVLNAHYDV